MRWLTLLIQTFLNKGTVCFMNKQPGYRFGDILFATLKRIFFTKNAKIIKKHLHLQLLCGKIVG